MKQKKQIITWQEFGKMLFVIALPIAIQNLLTTTASMVDTIMIGSLGETAVGAVGICSQIGSLLFSLYWGFVSGSILFLSQYWGAGDKKSFNRVAGYTFVFAGLIGTLYGLLTALKPEFILHIYTDKNHIIAMAKPYLQIVGYAYPLQVVAGIIGVMLKSTERVKAPLIASIISLLTNFCINYTLIYGRFGMPKLGIAGAAIGTLVSSIVNVGLLMLYLLKDRQYMALSFNSMFSYDKKFTQIYFAKLTPIVINEVFYGVGQLAINVVMGHQNESAIAAMAAFRVCEGFVYAFFGGLSNATSVVVGNEIGAGKLMRGYGYARRSTFVCPAITFAIVFILFVLHKPLFVLFGLGTKAVFYGKYMLLIYLFFGSIRTCAYIMNESFRAGGEAVIGTVMELGGLLLFSVPATWVAGMVFNLPFLAVFSFVYTDELLRLAILMPYMLKGKWVKPMTDLGRAALPEFKAEM